MVCEVGLLLCFCVHISVPIKGLFPVVFVAPKRVARLGEPLVTLGMFLRSSGSETLGYKSSRSLFASASSATNLRRLSWRIWGASAGHKLSLTVPFPISCKVATLLITVNIFGGQLFVLKVGLLVSHTESWLWHWIVYYRRCSPSSNKDSGSSSCTDNVNRQKSLKQSK